MADPAGFGVYVHWPFCAAKCPYCDFNSHVRHAGVEQTSFAEAYVREIAAIRDRIGPREVSSIFFGGGTPSLMEPATLDTLLSTINRAWPIKENAEISLEANPTSVEASRFAAYRRIGVNRVSLGAQALNDRDLKALGRLHSAREALAAIEVAANVFDRYSFDLIYARPAQSLSDWHDELQQALALGSRHLSLYQLTIENGTPFAALHRAAKLHPPEPELADDLFQLTQDLTSGAGLPAYEISNHAAPGEESLHNLLYWRYGEYAGVGPGAHGRIIVNGQRVATSSERLPEDWQKRVMTEGTAFVECEVLDRSQQADELLLMGLRIREGVDVDRLAAVSGLVPSQAAIAELVEAGLITSDSGGRRLSATPAGRFILNRLVLELAASFEPR